jgi:hypothetical protein
MNRVFTFHEYLPAWGNQSELISLWADSWRTHGWEPEVLNVGDCRRHKRWHTFNLARSPVLKSKNPAGYDHWCWARWIALAARDGGLMTDYDTINFGLRPEDLNPPSSPIILEQHRVPCAVITNAYFAEQIVELIFSHTAPMSGHHSDMFMFQASKWPHTRHCRQYLGVDWEDAPLVHFSTGACGGHDKKCEAIKSVFQTR